MHHLHLPGNYPWIMRQPRLISVHQTRAAVEHAEQRQCHQSVEHFVCRLHIQQDAANAALERLAHATTNKGYSPASLLQALVGLRLRVIFDAAITQILCLPLAFFPITSDHFIGSHQKRRLLDPVPHLVIFIFKSFLLYQVTFKRS